jgi:hypothetical protein
LVLGPLAENRLFLSTDNYGLAWLWRPGVLLLMALTLFGAFYPLIRARSKRRKLAQMLPPPHRVGPRRTMIQRFGWETIFSLFIMVVFIFAMVRSLRFDFRTGLFPWAIGFPVLALTIGQLIMDVRGKGERARGGHIEEEVSPELPVQLVNRRTMGIFGWILGYFAAIWLLGFSVGVPLCTFIHLKFGYREKWPLSIIMTVLVGAFLYGIFDRVLHVPFPPGQLLLWLGWVS